jgi:ribonuclease R
VLKAMSKAVYGPQVEPHFALDMDHYCHFTSPIRRYPDLTVHRLVQRLLDGEKTPNEAMSVLVPLGHHCSDQEQQAEQAERELVKLKLLHYLQKRIGETMQAVITVVNQDGILARGIELPAEGFIPVANLPHDRYSFERRGQMLIGFRAGNDFRLGDLLTVKVEKVDLRARELFYSIIKNQSSVERLSSRAERPPGSTYSPKHFKSKKKQLKKKKRRR